MRRAPSSTPTVTLFPYTTLFRSAAVMPAGEIAERLNIAPNALSFHLKGLSNAGLLKSWQQGRFVYYAPDFKAMNGLVDYLTENCCAGSAPAGTACATTPANCKEN